MSTTTNPPGRFCWHELGTRDATRAKDFYCAIAGFEVHDMPMGEMGCYTLLRRQGRDIAGLYEMKGPQLDGVPPHWLSYVAVPSTDEKAKRAMDLGGALVAEPFDVPGVGRMAVLRDPTGAVLALFQPGAHGGAARLENPVGSFCWTELVTRDTRAAAAFYSGLFGWQPSVQQMGPTLYTMWMNDGSPAGGMMEMAAEMPDVPPHWMPYIAVDDCDARSRQAAGLGATFLAGPMDVPGVGRCATLMDPTGAAISIIHLL